MSEGGLGGRQDGRFPESSYGGTGGFEHGREDGRVPQSSYGGEGTGSQSAGTGTQALNEGGLGGRQDGRFPESSYSGDNKPASSGQEDSVIEKVANLATKVFGNPK